LRGFRFLLRCQWGLRSSAWLRSVGWQLLTDVSGEYISPTFKGQLVLKMRQIVRPETSESNYQHTPRNNPEEQRTQIQGHCGSTVQLNI